jgi:hypothetical protein
MAPERGSRSVAIIPAASTGIVVADPEFALAAQGHFRMDHVGVRPGPPAFTSPAFLGRDGPRPWWTPVPQSGRMSLASNAQSPYNERQLPMSLDDIIEELPKLTPEERRQIYLQIERLDGEPEFEATPEMLAAIEEGTRSVQTEPTYSLEEARQRVREWASTASA